MHSSSVWGDSIMYVDIAGIAILDFIAGLAFSPWANPLAAISIIARQPTSTSVVRRIATSMGWGGVKLGCERYGADYGA